MNILATDYTISCSRLCVSGGLASAWNPLLFLSSPIPSVEGPIPLFLAEDGRVGEAFDRGGFKEWAEAAANELEEEGKIERRKRGL